MKDEERPLRPELPQPERKRIKYLANSFRKASSSEFSLWNLRMGRTNIAEPMPSENDETGSEDSASEPGDAPVIEPMEWPEYLYIPFNRRYSWSAKIYSFNLEKNECRYAISINNFRFVAARFLLRISLEWANGNFATPHFVGELRDQLHTLAAQCVFRPKKK